MSLAITEQTTFDNLVNVITPTEGQGMVAPTSATIYRHTYRRWASWCETEGLHPLNLTYNQVQLYLESLLRQDGTPQRKTSKQRHLSALRKMVSVLAILDYENPQVQAMKDSLKLLKVYGKKEPARQSRVLEPRQAERVLTYWLDQTARPDNIAARNQVMITMLLLTGIRRSELKHLTWSCVDFEHGTLFVSEGKGNKDRDVAIYGNRALEALRAWQVYQPLGYEYIITKFRDKYGAHYGPDEPMTAARIYAIVTETGNLAGVGHLKPHDARHTLLTEMAITGSPVHEMQEQAGHANMSTTGRYLRAQGARERRQQDRLRYG